MISRADRVLTALVVAVVCVAAAPVVFPPPSPVNSRVEFEAEPWTTVANLSVPSFYSSLAYLNDTFVVAGGCTTANCSKTFDGFVAFDPKTNKEVQKDYPRMARGVAGPTAFVTYGSNLIMFPPCTLHFGRVEDMNSTEVEAMRHLAYVSMDDSIVNSSYFRIPDHAAARVNASCVEFGNQVFIVGGVVLDGPDKGKLTNTIDTYDMQKTVYSPNVEHHGVAVQHAAVTKDLAEIYIVGGTMDGGTTSRKVTSLQVGDSTCLVRLPDLPDPEGLLEGGNLETFTYGGYLVVANSNRSTFAALDLQSTRGEWATFSMISSEANSFFPMAEGDVSFNETYSKYARIAWVPLSDVANGTQLMMLRFGGRYEHEVTLGINDTVLTTSASKTVEVSVTNIRLPAPVVTSGSNAFEVGSGFGIGIGDSNGTIDKECHGEHSPCKFRLSARIDCEGNAGGTSDDTNWVQGSPADFLALSAADPVYVCFSSGMSRYQCKGESRPIFSVTDLVNPLSLGKQQTPPPTAPPPPAGGTTSLLLYILGSVAALTTLVAVLLVARLRKGVPEEGLLGRNGGANPSGYLTGFQDERYKVISKIGEGAFSVVYLVVRRHDGAKFAMKHMECQSDLQRQEAIKECEIMRTLQGHPNVIHLIDMFMNYEFDTIDRPHPLRSGQTSLNDKQQAATAAQQQLEEGLIQSAPASPVPRKSRHLCLVMEYHPAGDLRKWVLRLPSHPSQGILCSIAFQICSVLKHIHAQEPAVIHRDLKPENILISAGGAPHPTFLPIVVTDFGLARMQEESFCRSGAGTLPYVAPECFKKRYTTQCDMWSLGCVLYAVATKRVNNDTVRLMFQDCTKLTFHDEIKVDLQACGYTKEFINFVLHLLLVQPEARLTAPQAFKLFRKRGELVYISSKIQPPPTASMNLNARPVTPAGVEMKPSTPNRNVPPATRRTSSAAPTPTAEVDAAATPAADTSSRASTTSPQTTSVSTPVSSAPPSEQPK